MGVLTGGDRSAAACLVADGADLVELDGVVLGADLREVAGDRPRAPIVTTDDLPTMAVHAALGPVVIRTHAVRAARRVCDVINAVRGGAGGFA